VFTFAFVFDVAPDLAGRVQAVTPSPANSPPGAHLSVTAPSPASRLLDDCVMRLASIAVTEWRNGQQTLVRLYTSSSQSSSAGAQVADKAWL
jgi:hypothetical protein